MKLSSRLMILVGAAHRPAVGATVDRTRQLSLTKTDRT